MSSPDIIPQRPDPADAAELQRRAGASPSPVDPDFPGGIDIGNQDTGELSKQPEAPPLDHNGPAGSGQ